MHFCFRQWLLDHVPPRLCRTDAFTQRPISVEQNFSIEQTPVDEGDRFLSVEVCQGSETEIYGNVPPIEVDAFQVGISVLDDGEKVKVSACRIIKVRTSSVADQSEDFWPRFEVIDQV